MAATGCHCDEVIDLSPYPIITQPENIKLHTIFEKYGYQLRVAGGAVRDILLGVSPKDIDYATNATPLEMNEMFSKENIRTLNRNGESHGTVTVRIDDKENFEVTTLRIDIQPDGRHSQVVFTNDWKLDAARRDLTVNSMFLSVDIHGLSNAQIGKCSPAQNGHISVTGRVIDYFNGRDDLQARRIRFVGDPDKRIKEDYLRILRYFRFHGRLSDKSCADRHDEETLQVIAANAHGLASITGERCWTELKKILLYQSTPALLHRMYTTGLFPHLGLPISFKSSQLEQLWARNILSYPVNPVTCLAALLNTDEEIQVLHKRLKLSNLELNILNYIVHKRDCCNELTTCIPETDFNELKFYERELLLHSEAPKKVKLILTEMFYYLGRDSELVQRWADWDPPKFPVNGFMLKEKWSLPNIKFMSPVLHKLRTQWVDSGYQMSADQLLSLTNQGIVMEYLKTNGVQQNEPLLNLPSKKRKK